MRTVGLFLVVILCAVVNHFIGFSAEASVVGLCVATGSYVISTGA